MSSVKVASVNWFASVARWSRCLWVVVTVHCTHVHSVLSFSLLYTCMSSFVGLHGHAGHRLIHVTDVSRHALGCLVACSDRKDATSISITFGLRWIVIPACVVEFESSKLNIRVSGIVLVKSVRGTGCFSDRCQADVRRNIRFLTFPRT